MRIPAFFRSAPRPALEADESETEYRRLCNPKIRTQIINVWEANQLRRGRRFLEDLEDHLNRHSDQHGKIFTSACTRSELEDIYNGLVHQEFRVRTLIDRHGTDPWASSAYAMVPNYPNPDGTQKATPRQMRIAAVHEKDHVVHPDFYGNDIMKGFDKARMDRIVFKQEAASPALIKTIDYLYSAVELVARMSQLKNYFGFTGAETFTRAHLEHARAHYVHDTGMNNNMDVFFSLITQDTEKGFLWAMNNLGI
jgi:hypothetical protein